VFRFDRGRGRFSLASIHPGVSAAEVRSATGFDYDAPASVPVTPAPDAETLTFLRTQVAALIADTYPAFAAKTWGVSPPPPNSA
jgi:glutaconate CoA-transferase subunit B